MMTLLFFIWLPAFQLTGQTAKAGVNKRCNKGSFLPRFCSFAKALMATSWNTDFIYPSVLSSVYVQSPPQKCNLMMSFFDNQEKIGGIDARNDEQGRVFDQE